MQPCRALPRQPSVMLRPPCRMPRLHQPPAASPARFHPGSPRFFLQRLLAPDDGLARERAQTSAPARQRVRLGPSQGRAIGLSTRFLQPTKASRSTGKKIIIYFNILDKSCGIHWCGPAATDLSKTQMKEGSWLQVRKELPIIAALQQNNRQLMEPIGWRTLRKLIPAWRHGDALAGSQPETLDTTTAVVPMPPIPSQAVETVANAPGATEQDQQQLFLPLYQVLLQLPAPEAAPARKSAEMPDPLFAPATPITSS